ncbi:MAG: ABC transporter ATP-binding protein [Parafilimonas terrae]|nr:ABC transporter ATP-binding protein [Parafilimonas terrae]
MSRIELVDVGIDYPIYGETGRSFKLDLLRRVGGRLAREDGGRVSVQALRNFNVCLKAGDRVGLIGPNGAGKSTLLKVLAGIYEPSHGTARISGRVSSLLDMSMGMDPDASGAQNTIMRAVFLGLSYREARNLVPVVEQFSELGGYFHLPMRTYSSGMSLRVAFAVTTAIDPEILIMDELIGVGDAAFAAKAQARLDALIGRAKILAIASHSPSTIRALCNRALLIDNGTLVFDGSVEEAFQRYNQTVAPVAA